MQSIERGYVHGEVLYCYSLVPRPLPMREGPGDEASIARAVVHENVRTPHN